MENKTKHNVCVKLTEKNIDKVYSILEMFGEKNPYPKSENIHWAKSGCIFHFWTSYWCSWDDSSKTKTLIKPKELKQILAKEHLKTGDIIVARIDYSNDFITSFNHFRETGFSGKNWVCLDIKTPKINTGTGSFDKFLRFATDEEKALLDPRPLKEPVTVTKEVWVNVYPEFDVAFTDESHSKIIMIQKDRRIEGKTVKGTLTYTLDND